MNVHLLLPEQVSFSQTDRYDPKPESTKGDWENTWHLAAGTTSPARAAQFLAVLLPHREGEETKLPKVELVRGVGAVGVRLTAASGVRDLVAFRTDPEAKVVTCSDIENVGQVFAQGVDNAGQVVRRLTHPRQ